MTNSKSARRKRLRALRKCTEGVTVTIDEAAMYRIIYPQVVSSSISMKSRLTDINNNLVLVQNEEAANALRKEAAILSHISRDKKQAEQAAALEKRNQTFKLKPIKAFKIKRKVFSKIYAAHVYTYDLQVPQEVFHTEGNVYRGNGVQIADKQISLYDVMRSVVSQGGYINVRDYNRWYPVLSRLDLPHSDEVVRDFSAMYENYLLRFEIDYNEAFTQGT